MERPNCPLAPVTKIVLLIFFSELGAKLVKNYVMRAFRPFLGFLFIPCGKLWHGVLRAIY
jgi:hypothetical protein